MHEMSIVEALVRAVHQQVDGPELTRVCTVQVRVGQLRQVVPEILRFCFDAAVRDTPLAGARLEVEQRPARARCPHCRQEFAVAEQWFECPHCGACDGELISGRELDLMSLELDEPAAAAVATATPRCGCTETTCYDEHLANHQV